MADEKKVTLKSALSDASNIKVGGNSKVVFTVDVAPAPEAQNLEDLAKSEAYSASGPLSDALRSAMNGGPGKKVPSLAFTENPAPSDNFLGLYKTKRRSLPDEVIKQVR